MQAILRETKELKEELKGKPVGLIASVFGCWHKELSRPFTTAKESYRVCLQCGARRHFNPNTLETYGKFYFSPAAAEIRVKTR